MCVHVLCLSPNAPPFSSPFEQINGPFPFIFSLPISLSLSLCEIEFLNLWNFNIPQPVVDFSHLYSTEEEKLSRQRMRSPSSLKVEFLKKWQRGLQICRSSIKNTSVSERRKAIKLTADIAMASIRKGTTCWSRALIANNASKDSFNNLLVHRILSSIKAEGLINKKISKTVCHRKIVRRSKKILKDLRRGAMKRRTSQVASIAKRLVKKRTQVLKSLVPGGEFMNDDVLLIQETLDYIASLRAQVDVMRSLVDAAEADTNGTIRVD